MYAIRSYYGGRVLGEVPAVPRHERRGAGALVQALHGGGEGVERVVVGRAAAVGKAAATSWPAPSRAAGNSAWRWPPACCMNPNYCCWTSPPPDPRPEFSRTAPGRGTQPEDLRHHRITSYNVCYTKLLRGGIGQVEDGFFRSAVRGLVGFGFSGTDAPAGSCRLFGGKTLGHRCRWRRSYNFV